MFLSHLKYLFVFNVIALFFMTPLAAQAQQGNASNTSKHYAQNIAGACLADWEAQVCLEAVSESTLVMAANYAGDLQSSGQKASVEAIKENCAAATAATRGEYPAYAMESAFTECANKIYDISAETGVKPDQSHYQLLVGAVLCLSGDRRCSAVERGLKRYR